SCLLGNILKPANLPIAVAATAPNTVPTNIDLFMSSLLIRSMRDSVGARTIQLCRIHRSRTLTGIGLPDYARPVEIMGAGVRSNEDRPGALLKSDKPVLSARFANVLEIFDAHLDVLRQHSRFHSHAEQHAQLARQSRSTRKGAQVRPEQLRRD